MYKQQHQGRTSIKINNSIEGETIEQKVERIVNNREPITDGAPIIFQERKEGVQAAYDVRTDRWEVAVEAMDAVAKAGQAKREAKMEAIKGGKKDGQAEPIQGQDNPSAEGKPNQ